MDEGIGNKRYKGIVDGLSVVIRLDYLVRIKASYSEHDTLFEYTAKRYEVKNDGFMSGEQSTVSLKNNMVGGLAKAIIENYEQYCTANNQKPKLIISNIATLDSQNIVVLPDFVFFEDGVAKKGYYEGPLTRTEMLEILMKLGSYLENKEKK